MSINRLLRVPVVALVAASTLVSVSGTAAAEETRASQWPLESFAAEELWQTSTGKGVKVAVVDTGFRETHQDLRNNMLPGKKFGNMTEHPDETRKDEDLRSHGSAMASIIAGHGHGSGSSAGVKGIAPAAQILPVTADFKEKEIAEAIRYSVDEGVGVINLSVARQDSLVVEQAVNYAVDNDVVVVAGVGNDGISKQQYPASHPGVVGVGAVDKYGKVWEGSNYNSSVDLLAPGVGIMAAGGEADDHYETADGTSNSTAYASGAAALIRAEHPELTAGQVANRLVKTAGLPDEMQGKKLPDKRYGYGFIRPRAALTDDIPAGPKDGPLPMPNAGDEGALKPTSGDGSTGSILEEWGPLVGGVGLGAVVVVGGIVWLVSRSRGGGGGGAPATGAVPTGMPNYPAQQGSQAYPAPPPGNQPPPMPPGPGGPPPPMPPGGQPPQMPPPGPGQYNQGGPGPYSG